MQRAVIVCITFLGEGVVEHNLIAASTFFLLRLKAKDSFNVLSEYKY